MRLGRISECVADAIGAPIPDGTNLSAILQRAIALSLQLICKGKKGSLGMTKNDARCPCNLMTGTGLMSSGRTAPFPRRNMMSTQNHFANVAEQIQKAPQNQRTEALISGIAQQMQSSNDQNTQQLGAELQSAKSQLVKACQQS
jgi:hypothetical protein